VSGVYKTDVSRTISVPIIRDLKKRKETGSLMMETEMVLETSVLYRHMTLLRA
jgi:hypothetical protein